MKDLTPEQLGVKPGFIPQFSSNESQRFFTVGQVSRGTFFQSPIQFPSPNVLPLSLKNYDSEEIQDALDMNGELTVSQKDENESIPYHQAIEVFKTFNFIVAPADMCYCLCDGVEIIYSIANQTKNGGKSDKEKIALIGADDFLPIFLYVVIQSGVIGIHRVLYILKNFNSNIDLKSELGYYISVLEIVLDNIMEAKPEDYVSTPSTTTLPTTIPSTSSTSSTPNSDTNVGQEKVQVENQIMEQEVEEQQTEENTNKEQEHKSPSKIKSNDYMVGIALDIFDEHHSPPPQQNNVNSPPRSPSPIKFGKQKLKKSSSDSRDDYEMDELDIIHNHKKSKKSSKI